MYKCEPRDICIKSGKWEAVILPDFGMNMVSLRYEGKEVLREPTSRTVLEENPYTYGIPLLFPANRTENGVFLFSGEEYRLPLNEPQRGNHIHGLMFDAPFTVQESGENFLTASYDNRGERYPFPFVMTIADKLCENGLERTVRIKNIGKTSLPYTLAFHTTFSEPKCFSVPVNERYLCNEFYIPTGTMIPLNKTESLYDCGIQTDGLVISGFYSASGHSAYLDEFRFTVSDNFDEWVLFNGGGGQGFLCIEPQCGEVNGLNRPNGHRVLKSGETAMFTIEIGLEG